MKQTLIQFCLFVVCAVALVLFVGHLLACYAGDPPGPDPNYPPDPPFGPSAVHDAGRG